MLVSFTMSLAALGLLLGGVLSCASEPIGDTTPTAPTTPTPTPTTIGTTGGGSGSCIPTCDAVACGNPDGCGGICGCQAGFQCAGTGQCVATSTCTETCLTADWACGEICGALCGVCSDTESCFNGRCYGTRQTSCAECALRLSVVEGDFEHGATAAQVVVAIDYQPADAQPMPRLADLRVRATGPAFLSSVVDGDALTASGKSLYLHPATGQPWKERADGAFQLLVMAFDNANELAAGRIATLTFTADTTRPLSFQLVKRDETFAPSEADAALQATPFDGAVGLVQQ